MFAHGTWSEYKSSASCHPQLVPDQVLKLKQLTVLTLAETNKVLPYDTLMQELDVTNVRELEDFLINNCMHVGIVRGKLDQLRRCFEPKLVINNIEILKSAVLEDNKTICGSMYHDSLIWRIVALGANERCLPIIFVTSDGLADALIIAHVGGTTLWESTRDQYFKTSRSPEIDWDEQRSEWLKQNSD